MSNVLYIYYFCMYQKVAFKSINISGWWRKRKGNNYSCLYSCCWKWNRVLIHFIIPFLLWCVPGRIKLPLFMSLPPQLWDSTCTYHRLYNLPQNIIYFYCILDTFWSRKIKKKKQLANSWQPTVYLLLILVQRTCALKSCKLDCRKVFGLQLRLNAFNY